MALMAVSAERLGYYRILRRLSFGGMSEVYLAYDEREQREVALKVVDMALDDHVQRFQREVEALSLLKHEHILPIFDVGKQDGWLYFAMPYLRHGSLRERLRSGVPLTLEEAGAIFEQVADALHYAHEQGVLHRDIKPSNILFRSEQFVYLADFGLAKLAEQEGGITRTGCLIGTPHYLAPELSDADASEKSDLYALGILLYKMLTGQVPFQGTNAVTICWKHIHEQPLPPSSLNPLVPPAIDHLILQALEKDPANRFSSVQQMAETYRQAMQKLQQAKPRRGGHHYFTLQHPRLPVPVASRIPSEKVTGRRLALNGFYRAAGAGAMIMIFCVAPLYLGFSLSRENMKPAQISARVQIYSTFPGAQPFLSGKKSPVSGQGRSVSLALSAELSSSALGSLPSQQLLPNGINQSSNGSKRGSQATGLTQSQQNAGTGVVQRQQDVDTEVIQRQQKAGTGVIQSPKKKGKGKGQVLLHVKGNGRLHQHREVGKQAGHGGHKKKNKKK